MRLLIDTHAFLWANTEKRKLSEAAAKAFVEAEKLYLSSVSAWEICTKHHLGKLPLPLDPAIFVSRQRAACFMDTLPFEEQDAFQLAKLPPIHKDPFDRMLIAQAIGHNLTILTSDEAITQYPVSTFW